MTSIVTTTRSGFSDGFHITTFFPQSPALVSEASSCEALALNAAFLAALGLRSLEQGVEAICVGWKTLRISPHFFSEKSFAQDLSYQRFSGFAPSLFEKRKSGKSLNTYETQELAVADEAVRLLRRILSASAEEQADLIDALFARMEYYTYEGRRESYLAYMPKLLALGEIAKERPDLLNETHRERLQAVAERSVSNKFKVQMKIVMERLQASPLTG